MTFISINTILGKRSEHGLHVVHQVVEDFAGSHHLLGEVRTGVVVTSNTDTGSLALHQLFGDLLLLSPQVGGQAPPGGVPGSQTLGPVESEVEVAAPVVQFSQLTEGDRKTLSNINKPSGPASCSSPTKFQQPPSECPPARLPWLEVYKIVDSSDHSIFVPCPVLAPSSWNPIAVARYSPSESHLR